MIRQLLAPGTDATIEEREALSVASLLSVSDALHAIGAPRSLLFASVNLSRLQGKPSTAIGAPAPHVARTTYTREARREQRQRQLARRGGLAGLARSLFPSSRLTNG